MRNKLFVISLALLVSITAPAQDNFSDNQRVGLSIYPNPVKEYLMVQIDDKVENVTFELNSMIGNKLSIRVEEMGASKYRIPVKDLATGYYFLIIIDEDKRSKQAFKFLKH